MPVACAAMPMRPPSERRKRDLVAFAFVADAIRQQALRNRVNTNSQHAVALNAEFFFFFADLEARRSFLDDHRGDSFFPFRRIGIHVNDRRVGRAAIGDPRFRAVDDVTVALLHRLGLQRRRVGARLRLGQRVATDLFPSRKRQQKLLFLLFGSEAMNRDRSRESSAPTG